MTPVFVTSGDLIADRRYHFGRELERRGDLAGAADLYAQAVEVAPGFASAWFALGEAMLKLDNRSAAIAAFACAVEADPDDRQGASLHLARLGKGEGIMPRGYVRALFDQYASRFDDALVNELNYRGPELLLAAVQMTDRPMRFATMLDLGCGTGLAGAAFKPHVRSIVGVDLSPNMVAQANAKSLYDRLAVDDIVPFLEMQPAASADLIVAADVFVYVTDLAPVFMATARVLAPDGRFAFTVETHPGDGVILGPKLRYAHAAGYVGSTLASAGLAPLSLAPASTRDDGGKPVPGLVVVANRS